MCATIEGMTSFICEPLDDGTALALWVQQPTTNSNETPTFTRVRVYGQRDQYPLTPDRYISNRPNVFLDIVDLLDGNAIETDVGHSSAPARYEPAAEDSNESVRKRADFTRNITLKALCQKAAHSAADGSGNARRFKDARGLWQRITERTLAAARMVDAEPIIDVRKTHNWKRNQPFKDHSANPVAWYVSQVYSRSNIQKNAIAVYAGLPGVFDAVLGDNKSDSQGAVTAQSTEITEQAQFLHNQWEYNSMYPTYRQIAELLGDTNMLVFHNTQSLIAWIREQMRAQDVLAAQTPCDLHISYDFPEQWIVGDWQMDCALQTLARARQDDETELVHGQTMTVGHYANVLEQYCK